MSDNARTDSRGFFSFLLYSVLYTIIVIAIGIVLEWFIMTAYYPEQGAYRSLKLMEAELSYLENSALISTGYGYAIIGQLLVIQQSFYVFLTQTLHLSDAVYGASELRGVNYAFHKFGLLPPGVYAVTTMNMINVMTLRAVVVLLCMPVFLVVMVWGASIGLTKRAIRRYQVRNETSFVFHHAKRIKYYSIVVPITIYMAWPNELSPVLVFAPTAALFGLAWLVMASKFKKSW